MKGFRKLGEPLFSRGLTARLGLGTRMVAGGVSDTTGPACAITSDESSGTATTPITATITFTNPETGNPEAVTGFVVGDITAAGCTLSGFTEASAGVYTVVCAATANTITLDVAAGVCTDATGNTNTAATQFSITAPFYANKVKAIFGANLLSYLPLWEASGAFADDYTANNRDGAYAGSNIAYGEAGVGDGYTSIKFTGAAYVNWYSASLAAAFNGAEGTVMGWAKVVNVGAWADATVRRVVELRGGANDYIYIFKSSVAGRLEYIYFAGGTQEQYRKEGNSSTDWMHIAMTWSKSNERVRCYFNGTDVGGSVTLGTWGGTLGTTTTAIGATGTGGTSPWSGWLAHFVLLNREATGPEVANAASLPFELGTSEAYGSSVVTYPVADGADIATEIAKMRAGDILSLATNGTYTLGAGVDGFAGLPSGIASTHTRVLGNGATVSGGEYGMYLLAKNYIDFQDLNLSSNQIWNVIVTNSNYLTFTDCDFYNPATPSAYDCWRADNSTYITLTRCNAHSTTDYDGPRAHDGFEIWGPASHFVFTDCVAYNIKNGTGANEGHGFEVYGQLAGQIVDDVLYDGCEAYNTQVGFSVEGGPLSLSHTNIICDGTSSHDNAFYGYEGIDGSTLYRQNLEGTDNTGNGSAETFGNVTDL